MIKVTYTLPRSPMGLHFTVGEYATMRGAKVAAFRHLREMERAGLPVDMFAYHFGEA